MNQYNRDELEPPTWIDQCFLEAILKTSENCKDLKIQHFVISPATRNGDHYGSVMFRATIEYVKDAKHEETSLIIKTMPSEDGKKKDMLKELHIFQTEIDMFEEVIPKFHNILRNCGDQTTLAARVLYTSMKPYQVIALEDIRKKGFTMLDERLVKFDEIHLILEKICRWHAISFKLINEGDTSLNKFNRGLFDFGNRRPIDEFFETGVTHFTEMLSNLPDKIYYKKFSKIRNNLLSNVKDICRKTSKFCVLNHGDFHIKNTMVKFTSTGSLQEIMLVDFQCCVLASAAIDIIYLLYMMTEQDCRIRREEVIYLYYSTFVDALKMIGYIGSVPSLAELHMEIIKYRHLEVLVIASLFPFMCNMAPSNNLQQELDLAELMESPNSRKIFYNLPKYTEELQQILPMLLYKGYFD